MASASLCCCRHFRSIICLQSSLVEYSVLTDRNMTFNEINILRKSVFIQVGLGWGFDFAHCYICFMACDLLGTERIKMCNIHRACLSKKVNSFRLEMLFCFQINLTKPVKNYLSHINLKIQKKWPFVKRIIFLL